ncbi:putative cell surface polysaccharide export ABC-2 transporter permease protein [Oceaniovalibus guishaninsula JLT2003]|uniref:Transport permease protein n=1 Tax=Oceaniovalibus guishaninsula JLT2003 TaxID=1231392 RepID=K2HAH3_9RHOB|nr:ABC transporter permease [Oceaniovalibus guishaninsula]EKE44528.1 putative cell surface polysaccharide export ABC-2 transporter permease protein [Oceaniovalibus guishaninsula JLT2003]
MTRTATDDAIALPPPLTPARATVTGKRPPAAIARTVTALVLREMSTRYGNKPGGYLWAIVEPLGMIAILALGFSLLLRTPPLGDSFLLFYATGFLPYTFFQGMSRTVGRSLRASRALLAYPVVHWIDTIIARIVLNTLTSLLVAYILLAGILGMTGAPVVIDMGPVLEAYAVAGLLGIGVGLVNCVLTGFFPIWDSVWGIITRPLFLASGVLVLYTALGPQAQAVLWWNPLIHVIGRMRSGFYSMYSPDYISMTYAMLVALPLIALGLVLLRRHHKRILE